MPDGRGRVGGHARLTPISPHRMRSGSWPTPVTFRYRIRSSRGIPTLLRAMPTRSPRSCGRPWRARSGASARTWLAADADDLTQIATTRVLARINQTSGKVAFTSGYLYRAVHSALVDEIRRRRRLREEPIEETLVALIVSTARGLGDSRRAEGVPCGACPVAAAGRDASSARAPGRRSQCPARLHAKAGREPDLPRPRESASLPRGTGGDAVSSGRPDSQRLGDALRSAGIDARPRPDCPPAEQIWAALHLEMPAAERERIIDHTIECPSCAEAWRLAMAIEGKDATVAGAPPARPRGSFSRRRGRASLPRCS